jgi:hypothetical protein
MRSGLRWSRNQAAMCSPRRAAARNSRVIIARAGGCERGTMSSCCSHLTGVCGSSPTVKPFNGGASTHRWARALLKGLAVALLAGCRCFTRSRAEQRRPREEKRKGAHGGAVFLRTSSPRACSSCGRRCFVSLVAA